MLSFLEDIKDKMDIKWVESMGGIILRTSLLDASVRLSPHSAPDNLSFHFCTSGCNRGMIRVLPKDYWPAILILRFHDIKTLAPRGVNNS